MSLANTGFQQMMLKVCEVYPFDSMNCSKIPSRCSDDDLWINNYSIVADMGELTVYLQFTDFNTSFVSTPIKI